MLWNIQLFRAERILWCSTSQIDRRRLLALIKPQVCTTAEMCGLRNGKGRIGSTVVCFDKMATASKCPHACQLAERPAIFDKQSYSPPPRMTLFDLLPKLSPESSWRAVKHTSIFYFSLLWRSNNDATPNVSYIYWIELCVLFWNLTSTPSKVTP